MSKVLPAVVLLGVGGCILYFGAQAFVPASLRVEQQAQATIQKIQLTPEQTQLTPAAPAQTAAEQVSDGKPAQLAVQRNAYLDSTIAALKTQSDKLICARAAFYQQLATQKQTELGVTPEQFLLDLLTAKNQELLTTATQTGGFSGAADLQATGRALTLDTLAIAQALQNNYQGQAPTCLSEPYQAGENAQNYLIRAQQYRSQINAETHAITAGGKDAGSQPQK
jgi:hypothetical protein